VNVTNEADKYMVQKILEKIPEIVENPEILARFDDKSQAFLKESYAKDIKMERTFEKEGSPSWKKASAEAEKTKNPIKNFSNKIKRGIINFFVKAGYIEEFDDGKEEPARQSENKNSEDPKSNAQTSEQRRKKETYKEQTNERQQEEQSASEKAENETADKENDNSEETETKSDEEKDEKKQDLSEEERQKQREKFKEQAKKVKERAEKDLNEYEKTKANSETKSDFDFYMNEVLIDMLDESIKIKLFDRRRIEPKYFGTDEEYKTKYDFFAKEETGEFARLKQKILVEKEPAGEKEKAEALKLITKGMATEFIEAMFPNDNPSEEELVAAREALRKSNMAFLDIRLERLGFTKKPDGTVRFDGNRDDIMAAAPYVNQLKKYDRDFSTLEVAFKNTREGAERFDGIISLLGSTEKTIIFAKEENDFINKISKIEGSKENVIATGSENINIDDIFMDPIDAKEFIYELKEIRDVTARKSKRLGFKNLGEERPRLSLSDGNMSFIADYEPRKIIKQLEVLSESFNALNLPNDRLKGLSKYKPEKYKINMLPSDKNGPDWKFEITGERTISMTGDAKICEMISSRLARGNEFKNITVNGKVIKGQAKEEGTQGAKKAKKQKTPKPDIQESDKYKENLETQIPEEYLNSSNNHSENTSEELPPEIEEQIVHESFQDTEEIKKKPVQTENFNEMNYGDNQENQLDLQSENLENNETQATGYFDFLSMQDQEENFFEIESQSPEEIEFEELGNQLYLDEMNGNNNAETNYRENLEKFAKGKSEKWKERARQEIEKSFAREKGQPETKISSKSKKETGKKEKSKKNDKNKGQAR
jgi:conserved plasmodium protein